jgi:hypothetical protein
MYPHLITDNTVTILKDGETHTLTSSSPAFTQVLDLIREGMWDEAVEAMSPRRAIEEYADGSLLIRDGLIYTKDGEVIDHAIVPHVLAMKEKGFDIGPLMAFLGKVLRNPSMRSRNQIWRFVSTNNITITPDGDLLFYKKVKSDYYDVHTGRSNCYKVGSTHSMPRHQVDDDPESTCSHGLHVCSYEYLRSFGGDRTILCQVDPADIVSVPIDYHNTKVRVARLHVVKEVANPTPLDTGVYDESDDLPF